MYFYFSPLFKKNQRCPFQPTSLSGGSPAGDPRLLAWWEVVGGGGQADGPDVLVEGDVGVQLHQGDVVVIGERVVVLVSDDPFQVPPHCPFVGLTLHVQPQQGLPLLGLRVPATTQHLRGERSHLEEGAVE